MRASLSGGALAFIALLCENGIIDQKHMWVLNDFGDDRLTVISCTDDGKQRQVVVGILKNDIQIETTSE